MGSTSVRESSDLLTAFTAALLRAVSLVAIGRLRPKDHSLPDRSSFDATKNCVLRACGSSLRTLAKLPNMAWYDLYSVFSARCWLILSRNAVLVCSKASSSSGHFVDVSNWIMDSLKKSGFPTANGTGRIVDVLRKAGDAGRIDLIASGSSMSFRTLHSSL
ncbi:hypothetical protein OGAPHI_004727 [Ogataea philodendri]|uniref:Uncharacterized protein n=1 Tax=Ogataea philodendri TaxID=1378263 RepID=A0A9P8P1D0_9ASCO|nr:uncharacterized protein OGAPHI_004727 [Ogataea philodendri]KAH3664013.1 hypothetical protein OGAPHI_004727 [Ogataea philodendri]